MKRRTLNLLVGPVVAVGTVALLGLIVSECGLVEGLVLVGTLLAVGVFEVILDDASP